MPEFREEVLNVLLAELLEQRGLLSLPETIRRAVTGRQRRLPDVMVADLHGVRIVIEGRLSGRNVRDSLLTDARARVEEGIAPICLAVIYPRENREAANLPALRRALARAELQVRVVSEGGDGEWAAARVDDLSEILRVSYELLVSEDVVVRSVEQLAFAIDTASEAIAAVPAAPNRLRALLGIPEDAQPGAAPVPIDEAEDEAEPMRQPGRVVEIPAEEDEE
jgi:hypothetical protein